MAIYTSIITDDIIDDSQNIELGKNFCSSFEKSLPGSEVAKNEIIFDLTKNVKQKVDFCNSSHKLLTGSKEEESAICEEDYRLVLYKTDQKEIKPNNRLERFESAGSFRKIKSSSILDSIQLGIRRSVGRLSAEPERDILMIDFMTVESTSFSTRESMSSEFIFKTYAPEAFRHFRGLFGINPEGFVSSFCDEPLVELPNPGASGSLLYLTKNDTFIIKTVKQGEAEFLQKLLPGYYLNLNQNPQTLLPKFFGLYCYKQQSRNVRLVVMNNIIPSAINIHTKYDLKGSTYNRTASKTECQKSLPTFKDLDFMSHHPEGIFLDIDSYRKLLKTVERYCRVLESFQIMDYSLLLGIHNLDLAKKERTQKDQIEHTISEQKEISSGDGNGKDSCTDNKILNYLSFNDNSILIQNTNVFSSGLPARQANGEQLLLFIGFIDILQSYKLRKRMEHLWKSVVHNGDLVSVHNPTFYSKRFKQFLSNTVFKPIHTSSNTKKKPPTKLNPSEKSADT